MNIVYALMNVTKQKMYIGSCSNLRSRLNRHFKELENGTHHNKLMQADHDELTSSYRVEVLYLTDSREEAYEMEKRAIEIALTHMPIYNILIGGAGGDAITNNPNREEIVLRRTKTQKRAMSNMSPEERKEKFGRQGSSNGMYGKTHTAMARAKIIKANLGRISPMRGKKMSHTHKENFMNYVANRNYNGENNPFYGKKHSKETIDKIRAKNKGVPPPCARPIMIDGVKYSHSVEASQKLNIKASTIRHRCKSSNVKFSNYTYV